MNGIIIVQVIISNGNPLYECKIFYPPTEGDTDNNLRLHRVKAAKSTPEF